MVRRYASKDMVGKVNPDDLAAYVFSRTGAADPDVRMGPAYGEDTAAIDLGEETLVINQDPISLAAERIGTLGIYIACNDVAASGADPRWVTSTVFVPEEHPGLLDTITAQLDETARSVGVAIVGGHSEYADRDRPLLVLTALGVTDTYIPTGGARPGDVVLLTKAAGIEGSAILAGDFSPENVATSVIDRAVGFYEEVGILDEARTLREYATAMHDPTEGGVLAGLYELAVASNVALDIDREAVPVRDETSKLCEAMGVDPLRIFGSGALLATVPSQDVEEALAELTDSDLDAARIGTVQTGDPAVHLGDTTVDSPVRDDLYDLWA